MSTSRRPVLRITALAASLALGLTVFLLLRNWGFVYLGNFVGAFGTAILVFLAKQYTFGAGSVGVTALTIGETKTSLGFGQAIVLGALCNALVCLAIWLTYGAHTTIVPVVLSNAMP